MLADPKQDSRSEVWLKEVSDQATSSEKWIKKTTKTNSFFQRLLPIILIVRDINALGVKHVDVSLRWERDKAGPEQAEQAKEIGEKEQIRAAQQETITVWITTLGNSIKFQYTSVSFVKKGPPCSNFIRTYRPGELQEQELSTSGSNATLSDTSFDKTGDKELKTVVDAKISELTNSLMDLPVDPAFQLTRGEMKITRADGWSLSVLLEPGEKESENS